MEESLATLGRQVGPILIIAPINGIAKGYQYIPILVLYKTRIIIRTNKRREQYYLPWPP